MSLTKFGPDELDKAWALGERMEKYFNDVTFGDRPAIVMEMEKAMLPYVLYKKKRCETAPPKYFVHFAWTASISFPHLFFFFRYISKVFESPDPKKFKLDYKGIELTRRDNCKLLQGVMNEIMKCMMGGKPLEELSVDCEGAVAGVCHQLVHDSVPMEKYVIQKSVRFDCKVQTLPHLQAALRLNARIESGAQSDKEPVISGQRVPYVVHRGTKRKVSDKLGERTDDPDWVRQKKLRVDRLYYAQKMVEPAVWRMCAFLSERSKAKIRAAFKEARRKIRLQLNNEGDIKDLKGFDAKPAQVLHRPAPYATPDYKQCCIDAKPAQVLHIPAPYDTPDYKQCGIESFFLK